MDYEYKTIDEMKDVLERATRISEYESWVIHLLRERGGSFSSVDVIKFCVERRAKVSDVIAQKEFALVQEAVTNLINRNKVTRHRGFIVLQEAPGHIY